MPKLTYTRSANIFGIPFNDTSTHDENGGVIIGPVNVLHGRASTGFTHSSNSTGTLVLPAGHAIITGQVVDLYWAGGFRYAVTVGSVAGTSVPISGGAGDNLPITGTTIVVSARYELQGARGLDAATFIAVQFTGHTDRCNFGLSIQPSTGSETANLVVGGEITTFDIANGDDNPFAAINTLVDADTSVFFISNGSPNTNAHFNLTAVLDATYGSSS